MLSCNSTLQLFYRSFLQWHCPANLKCIGLVGDLIPCSEDRIPMALLQQSEANAVRLQSLFVRQKALR